MLRHAPARGLTLAMVVLLTSGCGLTSEARKIRHTRLGDGYFETKKYREAIIEYRNVLKADPSNAHAILRLGLAHYQLGEMAPAYAYLMKSQEHDPNNLDMRVKLGSLYAPSRQRDKAREEVSFVLGKEPKNFSALSVAADAAETRDELDDAIAPPGEARAPVRRRREGQPRPRDRSTPAREIRRPRRAISRRPSRRSPTPWTRTSPSPTCTSPRASLPKPRRSSRPPRPLAPPASPVHITLADFYVRIGRLDDAKRVLTETTTQGPGLPSRMAAPGRAGLRRGQARRRLEGARDRPQEEPLGSRWPAPPGPHPPREEGDRPKRSRTSRRW